MVCDNPHPQVTQNLASTSTRHLGPLLTVASLPADQQPGHDLTGLQILIQSEQHLGGGGQISQVRLGHLQT